MRAQEVHDAISVPGTATTVNGAPLETGRLRRPFLPGNDVFAVLAPRAVAAGTVVIEVSNAMATLEEETGESVGATSAGGAFDGALDNTLIVPGSVVIAIDDETVIDDGRGNLAGDAETDPASGTIDYRTGAIVIASEHNEEAIEADYQYREVPSDSWDEAAEFVFTSANSVMRLAPVKLGEWVRGAVTTENTDGAGAFGLYLIGT